MKGFKDGEILTIPYDSVLRYVILEARDNLFYSIKQNYHQNNNITFNDLKSDLIYLYLNVYLFMDHTFENLDKNLTKIKTAKSFSDLKNFIHEIDDWLFMNKVIQLGQLKKKDKTTIKVGE